MDDKRKQAHLEDVDRVLLDVREHLGMAVEQGDVYELRALQLLLEVTKVLHSEHDPRALMTLILDSALSFAEADRAFLMQLDEHGEPRFKMGRTYSGEYLGQDAFVISTSVVQETLTSLEPIILVDAKHDEYFSTRQSIMDLELRTIMAAPLRHRDQVLGLIYVDSRRPLIRYSKHHLNVLTSLSAQAAVALHNIQKLDTHHG